MSADTQQRSVVAEHFSASSAWGARYDVRPTRMSDLDLLLRRENVRALLAPLVPARGSITLAEVGCGAGNNLEGLPVERVEIHGVDLSPEMVAEAARRIPRGHFLPGDATHLPYGDGSMDVVLCVGVLEYVPEADAALREMLRVLRPGGALIISFPNGASLLRPLSRLETRLEWLASWIVRRMTGRPAPDKPGTKYQHRQWRPGQMRELLSTCGYTVEQVLFNTYGLWGKVGRWQAALRLSHWLSGRLRREGFWSRNLAYTMVVLARRRAAGDARQGRPRDGAA